MKIVKTIIMMALLAALCFTMTGCGEKYVDLPEEICREWVLTCSAASASDISFFEELLYPHASYVGGYYGISDVKLNIIPHMSMYEVKYANGYGGISNPITIKYTGSELVIFRGDDEIGRCTYQVYDNEVLMLTFNENGEEETVSLIDQSMIY